MSTAQESAVRNYLRLLRDPATLRDDMAIAKLKSEIGETPDDVERLVLRQRLLALECSSEDSYVEAFCEHAKAWADAEGVTAAAFVAEGVPVAVLERAGFPATDGAPPRARRRLRDLPAQRHRRRGDAARAAVDHGVELAEQGRIDDELRAYEGVVAQFGDDGVAAVREQVARALVYRAMTLASTERVDAALAAYEEVVSRFGGDTEVGVRVQVAVALVSHAVWLGELGRVDEELGVYEEVVSRFGEDADAGVREEVARAAVYRAITLSETERATDAGAAVEDIVRRFGDDAAPGVRELVATAEALRSEGPS